MSRATPGSAICAWPAPPGSNSRRAELPSRYGDHVQLPQSEREPPIGAVTGRSAVSGSGVPKGCSVRHRACLVATVSQLRPSAGALRILSKLTWVDLCFIPVFDDLPPCGRRLHWSATDEVDGRMGPQAHRSVNQVGEQIPVGKASRPGEPRDVRSSQTILAEVWIGVVFEYT